MGPAAGEGSVRGQALDRRRFLTGIGATAGAVLLTATPGAAVAVPGMADAETRGGPVGADGTAGGGPPRITPRDVRFRGGTRPLRSGRPQEVGLLPDQVERVVTEAEAFLRPGPGRPEPSHPGFVVLAARDGVIVTHEARGHALRYARWEEETEQAVELPRERWVPMERDTLFDLASVSKLFTATVAAQLAEEGAFGLDDTVVRHLPEFASVDPAKAPITVRHLLTHRSGMISWIDLLEPPDDAARMAAIYASELQREPGSGHEYSDLNMITLSAVLERVTGTGLPELIADRITTPLGMTDTMFSPPRELWSRTAATEYQPWTGRGMVHGTAHDENAWAFGGVAGHAGLFSTARDLAVFGQLLADGGRYAGTRLLAEDTVRALITDHNADTGESPRGLGWQMDQRFYMDALSSPVTAGHTGYTGTSLVVDPVERTVFVLLTNRVHPTRERGTDSDYRRGPARALARAIPVRTPPGQPAWFAGMVEETTATLTAPLVADAGDPPVRAGRAEFRLWYDTDPTTAVAAFEVSSDGGTEWQAVPFRLRDAGRSWDTDGTVRGWGGRRWLGATATLPTGVTHVRWVYRTGEGGVGRGVYVDRIRVTDGGRTVFHGNRPGDAARLDAEGWERSAD